MVNHAPLLALLFGVPAARRWTDLEDFLRQARVIRHLGRRWRPGGAGSGRDLRFGGAWATASSTWSCSPPGRRLTAGWTASRSSRSRCSAP